MKKMLLAALSMLLLLAPQAVAQELYLYDNVDKEDMLSADTLSIDSLSADSISMPWPLSVQKKIARLLENDMFSTSQVGIMVYDLDADSAIIRHNERMLLRPASTMKLLTAITAMDKLGGSHQFKTELCCTGTIENNTLTGDIYCVGGFDPRFNSDDLRVFVESIQRMGIDTLRGNVCSDKSMKDSNAYGKGWCWDDDNPVLSPLLIGENDNFGERFIAELTDDGIIVEGDTVSAVCPDESYCVCSRFHTMDQILLNMLKNSDNLYAEAMFYQIAASTNKRPATADDATSVVSQLIKKIGLNPSDYAIADGSGLSLYNYVTAELEVALLRYAFLNSNIWLHIWPALPQAGVDGTLRNRMKGTSTRGNVRAKTGSVTGVSSLAGYCTAANEHRLAFAIINQGIMHGYKARDFQDRVCTILCQP